MPDRRAHVLMLGPMLPTVIEQLDRAFHLHKLWEAKDQEALIDRVSLEVRAFAAGTGSRVVDGNLMARFPRLEQVSSFGVGYDDIDAKWAGARGIVVTNTPDVLNEEVADTAIGLLLCTLRQLPQADRYLRNGQWLERPFPLGESLRERSVGLVGLGRIGLIIARRLDAMNVPVVYHARSPRADAPYRHYPNLLDMAEAVDVLLLILPGGSATHHLVNAEVLRALGRRGIVINVARGSVIDQDALISALQKREILSVGLDVFEGEPKVPAELIAMEHVVLFPHIGSSSKHTRQAMGQLVVDNLLAWAAGKRPLTPVAETEWQPKANRLPARGS